jgi:peroxiredoxin
MSSLHQCQGRRLGALAICFLLCSTRVVLGDEESSAYESFQRSVLAADPRLAQEAFKRDHSGSPSKEQAKQLVGTITRAAVAVVDQAQEFEKRFPQSTRCSEVRGSVVETLGSVFGSMGLPVPQGRVVELEAYTRKLMGETPDDVRLYLVLCRVAAGSPKARQFALYQELSREATPEPARTMAKDALHKLQRLGLPLELSFTALDGRAVNLAQLKGKVVLLDFWSTTCVPCIRELPDLKRLCSKYQSRGLECIGISLDSNQQQLRRFIQKEEIPWPQFYDPAGPTNRIAVEFGIQSLPVIWLVDRQGRLSYLSEPAGLDSTIEALLKEP